HGATWMTLSCGGNDIILQPHGFGVDLDQYKRNIDRIAKRAAAWNVNLVILTPTPIGPDLTSANNQMLQKYNEFLRQYAKDHHLLLADVNSVFTAALRKNPGKPLFFDATHPNADGQFIIGMTVLRALGVPDSDMPRLEAALRKDEAAGR
ncbi:MAG TPA: GDSL-type esterase/lipase family protein, partial [Tepidisphaeraceae bacterium]|nr:GDSL-type esterase/lipase family protein [Tepidisphaeraceae bacterium]